MAEYKGVKITGTSTAAKVFKASGVDKAAKGDVYRNTAKGHVYQCTDGGKADAAKWKYVRTDVVGAPTVQPKGVKLARRKSGSHVFELTWKVPDGAVSDKSGTRQSGQAVRWTVSLGGKKTVTVTQSKGAKADSATLNLASFTGDDGKARTLASFHPAKGKPKVLAVSAMVVPSNGKGKGPGASASYALAKPKAPTVAFAAFDVETGEVRATVETDAGEGKAERRDTYWRCTVHDGTLPKKSRDYVEQAWASTSSTSFGKTKDCRNYQQLDSDEHISVTVSAKARGLAGDSATVTKTYYVSFPKPVTVKSGSKNGPYVQLNDKGEETGKVVVPVTVNRSATHPVDRIELQRLVDVPYSKASAIPGNAGWEGAGAVDDGDCTALVADMGDLIPGTGNYTWVRVKAWHANEDALFSYSNAVQLEALHEAKPSAAGNECAMASFEPREDGASALATVAWDLTSDKSDDATTGVEVTWADDPDAWRSTDPPDSYDVSWADAAVPDGFKQYGKAAQLVVKGLSAGVRWYARARCYYEDEDGNRSYGPYCAAASTVIEAVPASAVLSGPATVASGSGVALSWTLSADAAQEAWQVLATDADGSRRAVMASGEGDASNGSCTVPWERVEPCVSGGAFAPWVSCRVAGADVESAPIAVQVRERPVLEIAASDCTEQPAKFAATCTQACALRYTASADGAGTPLRGPDGSVLACAGDVAATGEVDPEWELDGEAGTYSATVTLPEDAPLADGMAYAVTCTAVNDGLESEAATAGFDVAWSHQAPAPSAEIEVTPDEDGRTCAIALAAPEGAAESDRYDLYRLTHDGADLVASGLALDAEAVDEFAPFGDSGDYGYRVALRTSDGDVEWADFGYYMGVGSMRLDWEGGSVELPYDVAVSDGYEKDSEVRPHLDGTRAAHWNRGVRRKASLHSNLLRIEQAEQATALRALARHAGPVFVRTPDGSAYEADVQVTGLDADGPVLAVALDAEEVSPTGAFAIGTEGTE